MTSPFSILQSSPPVSTTTGNVDLTLFADIHLFQSNQGHHVYISDRSRIYDLPNARAYHQLHGLVYDEDSQQSVVRAFLSNLGIDISIDGLDLGPILPPLRSLSLNVAQACNMGCHYCYASSGTFGGSPRLMSWDVAKASVDRLFLEAGSGTPMVIGYMGGEPLLNKSVVKRTTEYATRLAAQLHREVRFSITTNATLIDRADAELFAKYPFTVQISLDGDPTINDQARPMHDGSSAYEKVVKNLAIIAQAGRPRHLDARVTITPRSSNLLDTVKHIASLGFDDVGVSPAKVSASSEHSLTAGAFVDYLKQMEACGNFTLSQALEGVWFPFGNFHTAMMQLHRGTHRPFPCGAGAAYLSVNAEGELFACHRLIDDDAFAMGNIFSGSDKNARAAHLRANNVDSQQPCSTCWARYLCGGGCYHEVSRRGRVGCDSIRGWLDFCLKAYIELSTLKPTYFQ